MKESIYKYMKVGLIHFMAYPETIKGNGPILETLTEICKDDFFTAVEISWITDEDVRKEAKKILESSHLAITYGAQPRLLINKLDLNSLLLEERKKAVEEVKRGIEEAAYLSAEGVAVLSGPHPGKGKEESVKKALIDSLKELSRYAKRYQLKLELESFDYDIDKKCLIGTSKDVGEIAKEVRREFSNFGILLDLSHFPIQHETTEEAIRNVAGCLTHMHLGNCIFRDKNHPAYGDQHPRFGIEGGENDIAEVKECLKALLEIDFLNPSHPPIVSFEIKPLAGEKSEIVIANAKRVLREAWIGL